MRYRRLGVAAAVLLLPVVLWGCQQKKTLTQPLPAPAAGTLEIHSVLEMPETAIASLSTEALHDMAEHGWVRTDRGFEHVEDPTSFSVHSSGVISKVQPNGTFSVADPSSYSLYIKNHNPSGDELQVFMDNAPITRSVDAQGNVHMVMTLSVLAHEEMHNHLAEHHTGAYLACNDYNGPYGNQKDNQGWWQDSINFVGSDCQAAFSSCMWYDFTKSPICNGSFNCSSLIGHCTGYHRHTYSYGPKC